MRKKMKHPAVGSMWASTDYGCDPYVWNPTTGERIATVEEGHVATVVSCNGDKVLVLTRGVLGWIYASWFATMERVA